MTVVFWDKQEENFHRVENVTFINVRQRKINGRLSNVWELFFEGDLAMLTLKQKDYMLLQVHDF